MATIPDEKKICRQSGEEPRGGHYWGCIWHYRIDCYPIAQALCHARTDEEAVITMTLFGEPLHDGAPYFWIKNLPEEHMRKDIRKGSSYAERFQEELNRRGKS